MSIKSSKTSRGVVIVNIPPPRWESYKKDNDSGDKIPTLENTSFNNVYIYNYYTLDERDRYNGFGRGSSKANPVFDFSTLSSTRDINGELINSEGFYRLASNKIPSYIRLTWDLPEGYESISVADNATLSDFKELVGLVEGEKENSSLTTKPMKNVLNYKSFEAQQNDFVRVTNEYLDMFSGVNSDGSQVNDWFAEEIDSSGFVDRQNFLWERVVEDNKSYKNFLNIGTRTNWSNKTVKTPSTSERETYFNSTAERESASVVNVSDSALLENLDFPENSAQPEDITLIQNTEYSWRTKILSQGFAGRILGSQERVRNSFYWNEFMNKLRVKSASGDIQQFIGRQPGPLESTLIRGAAFKTENVLAGQGGGISDFKIVGFVIEKEQVLEPGEVDEPGVPVSEKFPLIFVPCSPDRVPTSYLDAALNYDKEYKYTIRAIYHFTITIPTGDGVHAQKRSYFVNSTYSNILRVETREVKPPSFPRDLGAFYEYYKSGLTLNWAFPVNPQRDTTYFAIFRRKSIYEPFKLLQVYDFNYSISNEIQSRDEIKFLLQYSDYHEPNPPSNSNAQPSPVPNNYDLVKRLKNGDSNTTYTDYQFRPNTDFIYAVCSIDAHGQISNYGAQIKVNLDSKTHKLSVRQISPPGAPLVFPNWFIKTRAFVDVARTAKYRRAVLRLRPDYKKVKIGPGTGEVRDIVKTTDKASGGNSNNCYYLQILNPDRKDDIVLKYHINDSSDFDISLYEEREAVAGLVGLPADAIGRSKE